jgi:hypothetical protein
MLKRAELMQKITLNDIAFLAGFICLVAGVFVQFGAGPSLITAGIILLAAGLTPYIIVSLKRAP